MSRTLSRRGATGGEPRFEAQQCFFLQLASWELPCGCYCTSSHEWSVVTKMSHNTSVSNRRPRNLAALLPGKTLIQLTIWLMTCTDVAYKSPKCSPLEMFPSGNGCSTGCIQTAGNNSVSSHLKHWKIVSLLLYRAGATSRGNTLTK